MAVRGAPDPSQTLLPKAAERGPCGQDPFRRGGPPKWDRAFQHEGINVGEQDLRKLHRAEEESEACRCDHTITLPHFSPKWQAREPAAILSVNKPEWRQDKTKLVWTPFSEWPQESINEN